MYVCIYIYIYIYITTTTTNNNNDYKQTTNKKRTKINKLIIIIINMCKGGRL